MKRIIICGVIICSCLLLTGCGSTNKEKSKPKNDIIEIPEDEGVTFTDEKIEIPEGSQLEKMYSVLSEYGKTIYNNKAYENFDKKNDMYFISLQQLNTDFSYDISGFKGEDGTICDIKESGIYFDINHVMKLEYNEDFLPVLPSLVKCSMTEINNANS